MDGGASPSPPSPASGGGSRTQCDWGGPAVIPTLICFGFGYCAEHFGEAYGQKFESVFGTVRGAERAAILNAYDAGRFQALVFGGTASTPALDGAIAAAECALISVPPDETGDPVLAACGSALAHASRLRSIVYLSTVGVYGDSGGAWLDEKTPPKPG